MQSKNSKRRRAARRHRRLRWIVTAVLATGLSTHCVWADDVAAGNSSQLNANVPVLKSVGIKFRGSDSPAPKLEQPLAVEPQSNDMGRSGQVVVQNVEPIPAPKADVTLPPLVAGQSPQAQSASVAPNKTVTIEMRPTPSLNNASPKLTVQPPPKLSVPSPLTIQSPPTLSVPSPLTIQPDSPDAAPKIAMNSSPSAESPKQAAPGLETTEKTEASETAVSRSPEIVRIPSMTLVAKKESTPSAKPSLPTAATPTTASTLPLSVPKTFVDATPKVESPSLEIAKKPTPIQAPALVTDNLTDLPAQRSAPPRRIVANEAAHESPVLAVPKASLSEPHPPRTASKSDATIVALPVSNVYPILPRDVPNDRPTVYSLNQGVPNSELSVSSQSELPTKTIDVVYRTIKSLDIGRPIGRIDIADETICKAMPTESTSVILMGIGKGSTTVTVWPDAGQQRVSRPERFEVTVRDAWSSVANETRNLNAITAAEQSLAEMFPNAEIALKSNANGGLAIVGKVGSKEEAMQIAQLVRKMFLVPVLDRVAVASP